ncbi:MAG TPA: SdiA-regulated domain-containing protein [Flavilitoribacter sp.]|nr:SdiA-regulated domain-containing protein [Flavilitoribacter sp.]
MTSDFSIKATMYQQTRMKTGFLSAGLLFMTFHFYGQPTYHLSDPDAVFDMPKELKEISGISLSDCGKYLMAIQDEEGILFWLDKETGEVKKTNAFWKDGDYEDIAVTPHAVYVVKSTGTLYRITHWKRKDPQVEKFSTDLEKENDVEGLAYDAAGNRLLLTCKGEARTNPHQRDIFAFDLATEQFNPEAVYSVTTEAVKAFLDAHKDIENYDKIEENMFESDKELGFKPSALTIHPMTGEIYLVSSPGKMLLSMDRDGTVTRIIKLSKKMHPQPEGICFDTKGTMYISDEARDGEPGRVYGYFLK